MERTYTLERAAHARAVATAKGRRVGRPVTVDRAQLDYAAHLRAAGHTIAEIVAKTGIPGPACTGTCRPGPPSRSPPASCPPQSAECQTGVPHRAPLRESSPN